MANQTKEEEDEETAMVIKYASWAGAVLVFAAAVVAIFALSLPWWSGTQSSKLLIEDSRLDGTETTMAASISLWTFDLQVQLAPREGERDGEVQNIRATWDDTCAQAARTLPQVPYCAEVTLARALVIMAAILDSFSAAFVVLARRFSPLLLLAAVASGVLATLFCFGAAGLGVMTSTTGLGGMGYFLLGGSLMASGLAVGAIFYAAAKAMPPPPDALEEVRKTRMSNLQESTKKEREMAAILEENVQRRRRESEEMGMSPAQRGSIKRVPVMLQKVIFWTQENEDNEDAELPMELLQAAYQEIDEDGSGSVTLVELVDALKLCGLNASEAAATTVMQEIDKNMNGTIDIHEFVMFFRQGLLHFGIT
ncbi:CPK22 [Symbiodinium natans]|uniref:CPK22 protein n=1 Tax=Symbiodinium natans TaxID=878477 RepID=A0A812KAN2_9DINO|nr:CPK22 [Symbiodinium natans]